METGEVRDVDVDVQYESFTGIFIEISAAVSRRRGSQIILAGLLIKCCEV